MNSARRNRSQEFNNTTIAAAATNIRKNCHIDIRAEPHLQHALIGQDTCRRHFRPRRSLARQNASLHDNDKHRTV
jgi:hypothetical protein